MDIKERLNRWFGGRKSAVEPVAPPVPVIEKPDVEPEIVAAIATVLAIEVKVFAAVQGRRFTFGGPEQGWSEWGRLLVRPYQGVR